MIKRYCGRCGKEIKDPKIGLLRCHTYRYKVMLELIQASVDDWTTGAELCVDCEGSFIRWYNHPEMDDNE